MNSFIVSCTNDPQGGGLYLCDPLRGAAERRYPAQCMGLAKSRSCYVVASQALGTDELLNVPEEKGGGKHVPHSIVCLDKDFRVITEAPVSHLGMGDLHDIMVNQDEVWVADTLGNRIVVFAIERRARRNSLPFADKHITPVREWVDPVAREPDSSHVNSFCFTKDGSVWVSVFGRFSNYEGYKVRADDGLILDVTHCLKDFGSPAQVSKPIVVFHHLADPHSLTLHDYSCYFIESRKGRIMREGQPLFGIDRGYIRGMMFDGDCIWVGSSLSRHAVERIRSSCQILRISQETQSIVQAISIPAREVYTFLPIDS